MGKYILKLLMFGLIVSLSACGGGESDDYYPDTADVFRPSDRIVYLKDQNTPLFADITLTYGLPEDKPVTGDWDGDGIDTIGILRNGSFYLRNSNTDGYSDITLTFGIPGDLPVTGDWDGDGIDTIGIYRNGIFYLRNSNTDGYADITFAFGLPGDLPVAGDWDGDGIDTVGGYRNGTFFLSNSNSSDPAAMDFTLGIPGDVPIAGDWTGKGFDTVGVFRPSNGVLYLKNTNNTGFADITLTYGLPGDKPVTGDWNRNRVDTIGVYRNGVFYLSNSNGIPEDTTPQKYTLMVYMVGSDLESKQGGIATEHLNEMMQVGSTDNLNVIVTTGGSDKDDWKTVQRYIIRQGSKEKISDLGNLNMANSSTLQDFITWTISNYPADKYALILWDHGGGAIGGFGYDENYPPDSLSLPELRQALDGAYNATGKTFELIGFDACLMATTEVAYNMSPYGKYLVASEEVQYYGWNYTPILQAIVNNPSIKRASLGKVIADGYKTQMEDRVSKAKAKGETFNGNEIITVSVIDLSKIPTLVNNLDALSSQIDTNLLNLKMDAWIPVADGRSKTENYGSSTAGNQFTDMADLKHLAMNLRTYYQTEADALINSITQAVVYKINGSARPNANGLSIFLPYKNLNSPELPPQIQSYYSIDFSTKYKSMVVYYVAVPLTDTQPPTFVNETISGNTYSANVVGNDIDDVYAVIAQIDLLTGNIIIRSMATVNTVNIGANRLVSYTWTGLGLTLNGRLVSVFTIGEYSFDIPALLNGKMVDIFVSWNPITGFQILGAWPGFENGIPQREILPIMSSDIITPLFLSYNVFTNEFSSLHESPFTVGNYLTLGISALPPGDYYLGFLAVDYAQNWGFSQSAYVPIRASTASNQKAKIETLKIAPVSETSNFNKTIAEKLMEIRKLK